MARSPWVLQPFPVLALCVQTGVEEGVKGAVLSAFYWGYAISQASPHWGCVPPSHLAACAAVLTQPALRHHTWLRMVWRAALVNTATASFPPSLCAADPRRLGGAALWRRAGAELVVCAVVGCRTADARLSRQCNADGGSASGRGIGSGAVLASVAV